MGEVWERRREYRQEIILERKTRWSCERWPKIKTEITEINNKQKRILLLISVLKILLVWSFNKSLLTTNERLIQLKKVHIQTGDLMYLVVDLCRFQIAIYPKREYFIKANGKVNVALRKMWCCLALYNALSISVTVGKWLNISYQTKFLYKYWHSAIWHFVSS